MAGYRLTIRDGPRVAHQDHESLEGAIGALEAALEAVPAARDPVKFFTREIEPVQQVVARGEIAGPGRARGGVDLRGDGSAEAFTGRWRRTLVERRTGETAYDALARALAG